MTVSEELILLSSCLACLDRGDLTLSSHVVVVRCDYH